MLYELLLIVQVQFEMGVKGIILSLLPSFPLSVLGWYIKRRSQMKAKKYLHDDGLQLLVEKQETANITDTSIDFVMTALQIDTNVFKAIFTLDSNNINA